MTLVVTDSDWCFSTDSEWLIQADSNTVLFSLYLSIGTGLISSSIISLVFYSIQQSERKKVGKTIRLGVIASLLSIFSLFSFYLPIFGIGKSKEDHHFDNLLSEISYLEKNRILLNESVVEQISDFLGRYSIKRQINDISQSLLLSTYGGAISESEYLILRSLLMNYDYIIDGCSSHSHNQVVDCYIDFLKCIRKLSESMPELHDYCNRK